VSTPSYEKNISAYKLQAVYTGLYSFTPLCISFSSGNHGNLVQKFIQVAKQVFLIGVLRTCMNLIKNGISEHVVIDHIKLA
jgi:hypothetical protein